MQDMLVKLLELPDETELYKKLEKGNVRIFRPLAPDKKLVCDYVKEVFGEYSVGEAEACFAQTPVSMFIATENDKIVGFSCYEATARGFFGPMAVSDSQQGKQLGRALLVRGLEAMRESGYVYAIIGGVGPVPFYEKCVGAKLIEGSNPGIYRNFISPLQNGNK
ncbi:MAG: GNAT family N-acetyltransferase [Oscillospiraceae bacterium]